MSSCRRLCTAMCVGFIAGVVVILALDPETREKLWEQVVDRSEVLREKFKHYQQRLNDALELGRQEIEAKRRQLEKQISLEEEKKESPNYIV